MATYTFPRRPTAGFSIAVDTQVASAHTIGGELLQIQPQAIGYENIHFSCILNAIEKANFLTFVTSSQAELINLIDKYDPLNWMHWDGMIVSDITVERISRWEDSANYDGCSDMRLYKVEFDFLGFRYTE